MKKLLAALLACMTITCAFASCGDKDSDSDSSSKKKSSSSVDSDDEETDKEKDEDEEEETGENLSQQPAPDEDETEPSSESKKNTNKDKDKNNNLFGSVADNETYIGKWQGKELKFNGQSMDSFFGLPVYALVQFELYEDGTLTSDAADEHQEGTWKIAGDNTIEMTLEGESNELKYEDGLLFLSESEDGISVEFYLEKVDEFTPFDIDSWEDNFDLSGLEGLIEDADLGSGSGDLGISEDDINKAIEGFEDVDWESALGDLEDIDWDKALEGIDEEELEKALKELETMDWSSLS